MTILELVHSLRTVLMAKIESGSLSVGLIARRSSLTKSHISKFLHGRGGLSLRAMHQLMETLVMEAEDLIKISPGIPPRAERTLFIPVVASRSELLQPVIGAPEIERWLPLSLETLEGIARLRVRTRQSWWRFVAVRLHQQEARTTGGLAFAGSVIVIDRHYNSMRDSHANRRNLYAVLDGRHLVIGYADAIANQLVLQPRTMGMRAVVRDVGPAWDAGSYIIGRIVMIQNLLL